MKISIVTVAFNSEGTIRDTLQSVKEQTHNDIEHIIVDGLSTDKTMAVVAEFPHVAKAVSGSDRGLYDAINKGIEMATGDFVGILNSDDFLSSPTTISRLVETLEAAKTDAIYADVVFVDPEDLSREVRYYSSKRFHPGKFRYGYMPAHPTFYARRELFSRLGGYKLNYRIAADYELLIRFLKGGAVSSVYLEEATVFMRTGGLSSSSFRNRILLNQEIVVACRENGISTNMLLLSLKIPGKLLEYIRPRLRFTSR